MMMLLQQSPLPKPNPPFPPQPPQQSKRMMMIQQDDPLLSLQEHPHPQLFDDKSLIMLPPKVHLQCHHMQGGLGGLHKKEKKYWKYFICMCGHNIV